MKEKKPCALACEEQIRTAESADERNSHCHHVGEEAEGGEEEYGANGRPLGPRPQIHPEPGEQKSAKDAAGHRSAVPKLMDVVDYLKKRVSDVTNEIRQRLLYRLPTATLCEQSITKTTNLLVIITTLINDEGKRPKSASIANQANSRSNSSRRAA